ncbi:hypothetical protein ACPA54_17280 [Uniformispora flossi]|uniref:hypothetical protein n=1 Tax=Uniformispora flossi TaxID=3390723 RepID=UPI003C2E1FFB
MNESIGYVSCRLDEHDLTGRYRGGEFVIADLAELLSVSRAAGYRMLERTRDTHTGVR